MKKRLKPVGMSELNATAAVDLCRAAGFKADMWYGIYAQHWHVDIVSKASELTIRICFNVAQVENYLEENTHATTV